MQVTFANNIPILAAALFFALARDLYFDVLYEVLPAVCKDSPDMVF